MVEDNGDPYNPASAAYVSAGAEEGAETMPFRVTEDDLTDALFHGVALTPTGAGTKAEARRQARLMLNADTLLATCEALLAADGPDPRTWDNPCVASIATADAFALARATVARVKGGA